MNVPQQLNGYPVTAFQQHRNCATVMVIRDPENRADHKRLAIATWWPELKSSWQWGHYIEGMATAHEAQAEAQRIFNEVSERNSSAET